jgi:hypothetical protein
VIYYPGRLRSFHFIDVITNEHDEELVILCLSFEKYQLLINLPESRGVRTRVVQQNQNNESFCASCVI